MAQLISVKLSRFDASPWGFRLQGGKDFGAPLIIQKVRPRFDVCIISVPAYLNCYFYTLCNLSDDVRLCFTVDQVFSMRHSTAVRVK
jgi:hypothetical protein